MAALGSSSSSKGRCSPEGTGKGMSKGCGSTATRGSPQGTGQGGAKGSGSSKGPGSTKRSGSTKGSGSSRGTFADRTIKNGRPRLQRGGALGCTNAWETCNMQVRI